MFQVSSVIHSLRTLADGTWRLQVDCQEMPPEQEAQLVKLKKQQGWFLFKANTILAEDVPEEATPEHDSKSPSKRLYDRMFVFYQKKNGKKEGFRQWYADNLDSIGQKFLNKIEEL